ncbi:NmrA family NAD(P)-binding protein [Roseibium sp. SCPC15]|uniref:SDR family oxidoreductase n=1 Tax=Roseibium sp. SCP15 TaxID=3141376 RepID=UPI00333AE5E9
MSQIVAVFGATGAQGAPVVRHALEGGMTVRAVARDEARIRNLHPEAEAHCATLDDEEALVKALNGVDAAFLHLPMPQSPEDPGNWMKAFFAAAHRVSLPLLVFTTSGSSGNRYPSSVIIDGSTAGMKAVLSSGIPAIVLQPTIYLENLLVDVFLPRLRGEGVLDYPPLPATQKMTWTSHEDQARIAVAALTRPDLAGQNFEIGTPGAMTGPELAGLLEAWVGRSVTFDPCAPEEFGQRIGEVLGSPETAFALSDLYGALAKMEEGSLAIETRPVEEVFGVRLTPVSEHVSGWAAASGN